jgi:hypothetical protein
MSATSNKDYRSPRSCISLMRDNTQKQHAKEVVVGVKERLVGSGSPCVGRAELPYGNLCYVISL